MNKKLSPSEQYVKNMEKLTLEKETFRNKLIELTTKLIDDKDIEKTPEMVLAIAEVSKICLDGFNPRI
ncbi:hypothetical protein [Lactococcus lactis]|jgi:hypothetical protein|uniref:hypothetical protein n=1 Tax=Lactococcus lactis TaxID=1358 RepID=UPI001652788F|nr:hypothetical protein [Lactococcus lactis]QNL91289.1 hypothetical protein HUG14_07965 [Lactococcus lactis]WFR76483.1 hypothetical protein P9166_04760 [Lactococcus lactis]